MFQLDNALINLQRSLIELESSPIELESSLIMLILKWINELSNSIRELCTNNRIRDISNYFIFRYRRRVDSIREPNRESTKGYSRWKVE